MFAGKVIHAACELYQGLASAKAWLRRSTICESTDGGLVNASFFSKRLLAIAPRLQESDGFAPHK